jgi:hypothetical protein
MSKARLLSYQVRFITARVVLDVPDGRHLEDVPLDGHVELGEVDPDLDLRPPVLFVNVPKINLKRKKRLILILPKVLVANSDNNLTFSILGYRVKF